MSNWKLPIVLPTERSVHLNDNYVHLSNLFAAAAVAAAAAAPNEGPHYTDNNLIGPRFFRI